MSTFDLCPTALNLSDFDAVITPLNRLENHKEMNVSLISLVYCSSAILFSQIQLARVQKTKPMYI